MSITVSNGHSPKRRKLSHGSDSQEQTGNQIQSNGNMGSDAVAVENGMTKTISGQQSTGSGKKSASTMATGGMTKSAIMQLQADELIQELKADHSRTLRELRSMSEKLTHAIKSIPEQEALPFSAAEKYLRKTYGVSIPFVDHRPDPEVKYKFEYKQPTRISVRSELMQILNTQSDLNLEMAVEMPESLFQDKDYLNYRALHKRAYYMASVAAAIKNEFGEDFVCRYELQNGNGLVPNIVMKPKKGNEKIANRLTISVDVVLPGNVGSVEKMLPPRNCVRSKQENQMGKPILEGPTPFYNSSLRLLASTADIDQLLEQAIHKCDSFIDACILGQTWLRQRGFTSEITTGGFGPFEWAYACALLLAGGGHKGRPLFSERYSSVQLFKAMLQLLANRDLMDPLLVRAADLKIEKGNTPVLFDGLNGVNVLSKVSTGSYDLLRHYAQQSLTAVNTRTADSFEASFITKVAESCLQFDETYVIDGTVLTASKYGTLHDVTSKLYLMLKEGLGDRVSLVHLKSNPQPDWDLSSPGPKHSKHSREIQVRLLCNPDSAQRLIDHGPTAEEQEAARAFRQFWGEKAELRRFRDGSITESLTWSSSLPVTLQIIQYLAAYHLQILPSLIRAETPDLSDKHLSSNSPVNAADAFKLINNKYQELSSKLHQMEGLPLPIRSVSPAGEALRSSRKGYPLDPGISAPIDILIQFDSSARWPDHLLAIQHTKIAFLAKISDLIKESDSSLDTRIGLENRDTSATGYHNTSFLDIISPSPAPGLSPIVFRLRIHHEREVQLLQGLHADKSLPNPTRDKVTSALTEHKRTFIASPAHTAAMRNLVTHFQPLSTTMRLLKSWIASHNLSNHVPKPVLEIIAARVFLQPYPWSTPGDATTAFLRCLHFLSNWDWTNSPLVVDLSVSQDMTSAQATELETRFQAWRKLDPNMNTVAWFIGTNTDDTGTIWTQGAQPARVVAGRVTALAKAAVNLFKTKGSEMRDEDWSGLFVSPTSDYDFVIHLKPSVVRGGKKRGKKNGEIKFKNLQVQEELDVDSIGHDVVALYLTDLEKVFASAVLFFYGEGAQHIAGLWRPSVVGRKEWRVRLGYSAVPYAGHADDEDGQAKAMADINKEGILAEMATLGDGMIEKISTRD